MDLDGGLDGLDEMDAEALLAAATDVVRRRRLVEVDDLLVVAQWAAVHTADPTAGPDGRRARLVGDVLVPIGGEGTPPVQDFCLGEIALARGTGVTATTNAMADVLDLMHRLPRLWAACRAGDAEVWLAQRVAKLSRHLSLAAVAAVDDRVAGVITTESGGRVLEVAEGAIVAADPALADERAEAEKRRRFVALGRIDAHGLRTVIARVTAGDAAWIDATLARVVEIITPNHPDRTAEEVRSVAFGYLARHAELLALLLDNMSETDEPHLDIPAETEPEQSRATAFPADLLDALRDLDPTRLRPKAVLHVHLHQAALTGAGPGVARTEGLGPVTLAGLRELLAGRDVRIRPVLDLSARVRTTAYEHPDAAAEAAYLITGGDYWPWATSTSRHVDRDHVTPYDPGGPPGQTGTHNCGPLGRRHHRWKTHAGYRARQSGLGRYAWLTPHGLGFLVDHHGTRAITRAHARMIIDAPPGLDLYPADLAPRITWAGAA